MRVSFLGHSGFAIECGEVTLVFDYYIDEHELVPEILERAQRVYVFVSHSHRDHLNPDIFSWNEHYRIERYVIANECRRKLKRSLDLDSYPITFLHHDEDWADEHVHVHAFNSTDVGVCFMVDAGGRRIFHAGDYNCWHFELINDEHGVRKAVGDFKAILQDIKAYTQHVDLAMYPITPNIGGDFALGARLYLQAVPTKHFIVMHTWGRDREASEFSLYRNPDYGECHALAAGKTLLLD
ncbi:MAG: MBL fold metallo-hydrolase [Muribaculaceae bacterium]|nr:MBL fold metallo-hydrolase [Muribaculaceae bacterium]